jgi:putative peptidoglycan lipid II flippase
MAAVQHTESRQSPWGGYWANASLFFTKASLVRNAVLVSALTVTVKIAGAAKVAISARVLGPGDDLDAYLVAFLVPSIVCDVLAGSLTPALIPALASTTNSQTGRNGPNRVFFLVCLGVFSIAMLIAAGASGWILAGIARGFSTSKLELTRSLLILMVPMVLFSGVSAMWRAILNHQGRFALSAGSPLMTPLLASLFLLVTNGQGIQSLALGTVLGSATEAALLGAGLALTGTSILPKIQQDLCLRQWLSIGYVPLLFASALSAGSNVVDQTIAASLGPGSVSILNLGTRLAAVLFAIGPASVATVLMPRFSKLIAEANWSKLRRLVKASMLAGMLPMIPLAVAGAWFAKPLAEFAFTRGAGVPAPIGLIATVQALSFLQLPFVMGAAILGRLLISLQMTQRLFLLTAFALGLKVVLGLFLTHLMGIAGLALSMSCVQLAVFLMTLRIASKAEIRASQSSLA